MPFNVQQFRASLVADGARASLFDVQLTFPTIVGTGGTAPGTFGSAQQLVTFRAKATALPADSISSIGLNYFGREVKIAGNRTFTDWSITVIQDEPFVLRNAFERWMSGMNSHVSNLRAPEMLSGDGGYQQDGLITQYGKLGNVIKQYKMIGCFPTDVSAVDVDWSAPNVEEFQVTFAYQWWESIETTDSASASGLFQTF